MDQVVGQSTEEKIKVAATKVFVRKGYAATKTRDIAEEAGINIASLHYYFRSKDKLFEIVIGEAMKQFSKGTDEILNNEKPLHEKIKHFVEREVEFFKKNPAIPLFIMAESQNNAEKVGKMIGNQQTLERLELQLSTLAKEGVIRKIHPGQFMMNMVSLTVFPFISRPLVSSKLKITDQEFDELLEERKQMVPEIMINYLYLQKPR